MKSAFELRAYRRCEMRKHLEEKMLEYANNHYLGYSTNTHDCPSWLREELKELGYEVSLFGTDNDRVQILFGETERD